MSKIPSFEREREKRERREREREREIEREETDRRRKEEEKQNRQPTLCSTWTLREKLLICFQTASLTHCLSVLTKDEGVTDH